VRDLVDGDPQAEVARTNANRFSNDVAADVVHGVGRTCVIVEHE
jgi:hypothetical protein